MRQDNRGLTVDIEMDVDLRCAHTVPGLADEVSRHVPGEGAQLQPAGLPSHGLNPLQGPVCPLTPPDLRPGVSVSQTVEAEAAPLPPVVVAALGRPCDGGRLEDSEALGHG